MARYAYEIAETVKGLQSIPQGESVVVPLNAWFGLEAINAPVNYIYWGCIGDEEMVVLSAQPSFADWANGPAMDEVHITNFIRQERSAGTRMAISSGMGRGKTSQPVKAAWAASYRRCA